MLSQRVGERRGLSAHIAIFEKTITKTIQSLVHRVIDEFM